MKVKLSACPQLLTYQTNVRRKGQGKPVTCDVWLVEVRVLGTDWDPHKDRIPGKITLLGGLGRLFEMLATLSNDATA